MASEGRDRHLMQVGIDFIPNSVRTEEGRLWAAGHLRAQFEQMLPSALDRYGELPATMTHVGAFTGLLDEARKHYVWGRFYSCVVMCGVVAERILKDLLLASLRVPSGQVAGPVPEAAAKHLERLELEQVREFLVRSGKLDEELRKPARELARLRNKYAHGGGDDEAADARAAVHCLHSIVEGTVSVFKNYEIVDGMLVPRQPGDAE